VVLTPEFINEDFAKQLLWMELLSFRTLCMEDGRTQDTEMQGDFSVQSIGTFLR
jgi:hypothetical protein